MSFLIAKCYKEFLISVFYYFSFTETAKPTINQILYYSDSS